jgi:hypothetical protein
MSRRAILIGGCLALLLGSVGWLRAMAYAPAGTDEEQILAQIQRAERAAELLSASGLMRVVSGEYKDENGITRPVLGHQARARLRESTSLDVTVPLRQLRIQVAPDRRTATSRGPVELRITDRQGQTRPHSLTPAVEWRKEPTRRYLLFPVEEWRVVRVQGMTELAD